MALLCFLSSEESPKEINWHWPHPSQLEQLETAVVQDIYSVESQQAQHTARPQKLLSDS